MTQNYSPQSFSQFPDPGASGHHRPPAWSVAAITGFIFAFLLVLAPLGILLGIVGLFRTRGGQRKGRGLSIAAIPIGLAVSAFTGLVILSVWYFREGMQAADAATTFLKTSIVHVPEQALDFHTAAAQRFQLAVSAEELEAWLRNVVTTHGSLQNKTTSRDRLFEIAPDQSTIYHFTGQFVNGAAHIAVTIGRPDGVHPEVFDISVDGKSPIGGD